MNATMIEFLILAMTALVIMLAYYIHQALGEIDDLYDKIDLLEAENAELDQIARTERHTGDYYKMLYQSTFKRGKSA